MAKVGITTTVPIEVIYTAGHIPVDLNNAFVSRHDHQRLVEEAELAGFPRNFCAWIKGIYGTVREMEDLEAVIAVTQGDCSNTHALMEILQMEGIEVIPFAYPYERDYDMLRMQLDKLIQRMGVEWDSVHDTLGRLNAIRAKAHEIDEITWRDGLVSGYENHLYLVSCSDMEGDPEAFEDKLEGFLEELRTRDGGKGSNKRDGLVRLGYVGVPPIAPEIYDFCESMGARVVFNETQRQFSLPFDSRDLVEKYLLYSYPYSIFYRLIDIKREVDRRKLDGVLHYVQSFCFRQVEDMILRRSLHLPILTVELDHSVRLDARTRMRLENFVSMLKGKGEA
jgi:benzoyl-CoA reductase/2-hydroxyglutaryl-CoA dehydratase subunit BcrC/BadD/HgdB